MNDLDYEVWYGYCPICDSPLMDRDVCDGCGAKRCEACDEFIQNEEIMDNNICESCWNERGMDRAEAVHYGG